MVHNFNKGDVVRLKSGGPKMTIDYIGPHTMGSDHDEAQCSWFELRKGTEVRRQEWFELTSLAKPNEDEEQGAFYPGNSIMG